VNVIGCNWLLFILLAVIGRNWMLFLVLLSFTDIWVICRSFTGFIWCFAGVLQVLSGVLQEFYRFYLVFCRSFTGFIWCFAISCSSVSVGGAVSGTATTNKTTIELLQNYHNLLPPSEPFCYSPTKVGPNQACYNISHSTGICGSLYHPIVGNTKVGPSFDRKHQGGQNVADSFCGISLTSVYTIHIFMFSRKVKSNIIEDQTTKGVLQGSTNSWQSSSKLVKSWQKLQKTITIVDLIN
jgi:hypothetical protein